jgi:hypothetical protein
MLEAATSSRVEYVVMSRAATTSGQPDFAPPTYLNEWTFRIFAMISNSVWAKT